MYDYMTTWTNKVNNVDHAVYCGKGSLLGVQFGDERIESGRTKCLI